MADCNFTRVCTSCKQQLPATPDYFHAYKRAPDGRRSVCIKCRARDHAANKAERSIKKKEHYQKNKDRLLAAVRANYRKNADALRAAAIVRHNKNRDKNLERMRAYRLIHVEALNERRRPKARKSFHERYGLDLVFTLKHRTKALVNRSLRAGKFGRKTEELLGYSIHDLKAHIERQFLTGMSWDRFLKGEIHLDHIIPISFIRPENIDSPEFRACWALSNLRPMWARDNLSKGAKLLNLI